MKALGTSAHIRSTVESWYQHHGAALVLFGIALLGDRARAQDAVHQIFLKLLEYSDLGQIANVRTYLFVALRNTIVNDIRRRECELPLEWNADPWFESPNRDYVEELNVRGALAKLPEDQREVTILHIWGGLTLAQTAEVLGINANTAAARYRYALAKLRDTLSAKKGVEVSERPDG
ncbi:MAG: RNA polymerase sigma factor [Acidobacteria bacterium]|nr:RNA polymerase sigma factor [Acidobacteriota bacterium]